MPVLYGGQGVPRRVGGQRRIQCLLGGGLVAALEHHKDVVGVIGDDPLQAQVFQQAGVAVRNVHGAQVGQDLAQHGTLAVLHLAAGAGRAQQQYGGGGPVHLLLGLVHLGLHVQAVGLVVLGLAGDLGADVQHLQVVGEAVDAEVEHRHPQLLQAGQQLHVGGGVAAGNDQVGLGGNQFLQVGLHQAAQIGHVIPQVQVKVGPGIAGGGHQGILPAGQAPHVGIAAQQHGHPLGFHRHRDLPVQRVGEGQGGACGSLRRGRGFGRGHRLGGGGGGGAGTGGLCPAACQQQDGAQGREDTFHHHFVSFRLCCLPSIPCRAVSSQQKSRRIKGTRLLRCGGFCLRNYRYFARMFFSSSAWVVCQVCQSWPAAAAAWPSSTSRAGRSRS